MDGSVPSNPHLKWHIGNSLAYLFSWCVFTRKSAWRWDIGGKQANHQQSCLLIDPAKNLMINWFVFIQLSLSVLKLAGHNSMEWQEQRLAVERLPCSEIEQFSLGKIWKENRVIQSSISSRTALCHKPSPEMGHSRWDIRGNWTLLLFFQWMVQFPIILTSNGTYECW